MRGGKRVGAGRKPGAHGKATVELQDLARQYTEDAVRELARLSVKAQSEPARVAAIKELLDRGYGKSKQPLEHSGNIGHESALSDLE